MRLAFRAIVGSFDHATLRLGSLIGTNLLTTLLSIPLLALAALVGFLTGSWIAMIVLAALLAIILPSPASSGVQYLAHALAHEDPVLGARDSSIGFRQYGRLATRVWLVSVATTVIILGNLVFYFTVNNPIGLLLRLVWIYLLVIWVACHLYIYPLMIEQRRKSLPLIYRNALVMCITHPLFTLLVTAAWLAVIVLTSLTGLVLIFGFGLAAAVQQEATLLLLTAIEEAESHRK